MLQSEWPLKIIRFVRQHGGKGIAIICIIALALSGMLPILKTYQSLYLATCLTAIVWTVLDIKLAMEQIRDRKDSDTILFDTMRDARTTILTLIMKQVKTRNTGQVTIVGGRFRSIIDFLREFATDLEKEGIKNSTGCNIQILMMDPDFVSSLTLPSKKIDTDNRHKISASQIRETIAEIKEMSGRDIFLKNNITLSVSTYDDIPFGYYYIFGDNVLLFGGYWWNDDGDLLGPSKPCWLVTNRSPEFNAMSGWLLNRVELYRAGATARAQMELAS
jgi:hypothetical protein